MRSSVLVARGWCSANAIAVEAAGRNTMPREASVFVRSVAVRKVHHSVAEVLGAVEGFAHRGLRIGVGGDETGGEVRVDLPVHVPVGLDGHAPAGDAVPERG